MSASSGYGTGGSGPVGPTIDTITGNSGGPVGPDGANNINIIGAGGVVVAGNPGTNTLTITVSGIATLYTEDTGTAAPSGGNLNIFGGASTAGINIHTFGSGSTVDIILNDSLLFPSTSSDGTMGVLYFDGETWLHNYATAGASAGNTFVGYEAGNLTSIGGDGNVGIGAFALTSLVGSGFEDALENTAVGNISGTSITDGTGNCLLGAESGKSITTGNGNVCIGLNAGKFFTTGDLNVLIGGDDNSSPTSGPVGLNYVGNESFNILIQNVGIASESGVIRIGTDGAGDGEQNAAYFAGIYNRSFASPSGVVQIDDNFKLGSSAGTNGQILIGSTGASAVWSTITAGANIAIVNGANSIEISASGAGGGGAVDFPTDAGTAVESGGILNIFSGATSAYNNMNTTGSGNTVSVRLNDSIHLPITNMAGTTGLYSLGANAFMHNYGSGNTFLGGAAGNLTLTTADANDNTGIGLSALTVLTTGAANTAVGSIAGTAITTGFGNVCVGNASLLSLITGDENIAIGTLAGFHYTSSESSNIIIGNSGTVSESNTIRIGTQGTGSGQQNATYIAGIYGATIGATNQPVFIDNTGKLGAGSSNANNGLSLFYYVNNNETTSGAGNPYTYFVGSSEVMDELYDLFQPVFPGTFFPGDGAGTQASFTAPVTGIYQINWTAQTTMGGGTFVSGYSTNIRINGSILFQETRDDPGTISGFPTGGTLTSIPAIPLSSGDVVDFAVVLSASGTIFIAGLSQSPTGYKSYVNIILIREI